MKYIRTVNSIKTEFDTIRPQLKIKEANSIYELCDEVILEDDRFGKKERVCISSLEYTTEEMLKGLAVDLNINVYGAIWTEKGLIFAAKMNKKGEFILI